MQVGPFYVETNTTWHMTNTAGYWGFPYYQGAPRTSDLDVSVLSVARRNLAFCREVSLDVPARLRPQTVGMKLEYFVARNRAGSSGRPGYRRRRCGGRVA